MGPEKEARSKEHGHGAPPLTSSVHQPTQLSRFQLQNSVQRMPLRLKVVTTVMWEASPWQARMGALRMSPSVILHNCKRWNFTFKFPIKQRGSGGPVTSPDFPQLKHRSQWHSPKCTLFWTLDLLLHNPNRLLLVCVNIAFFFFNDYSRLLKNLINPTVSYLLSWKSRCEYRLFFPTP